LLEYPAPPADSQPPSTTRFLSGSQAAVRGTGERPLTVGFIGAGNYASSMLLPHLARLSTVRLAHVATTRSLSAVNAQRRFGFAAASTSADAVLDDPSLDAIFIVTRHHTHADLVCRALQTGKAVFVEKPLALTRDEVQRVIDTVISSGNDRLMVGFNRRFSPLLVELKSRFGSPGAGSVARYLVNAGPLDADSWYRNEELEGSRFTGEGGHFIDTLSWWVDSLPEDVYAVPGLDHDDLQATVRFQNGSCGTITYITAGNARYPKETLDAAANGRTARLDNFRDSTVWAGRRRSNTRSRGQDKGQSRQVAQFAEACRTGGPMPISLESLLATTLTTIAVGESIVSGKPERP
jgi:predicted dehydrogenase